MSTRQSQTHKKITFILFKIGWALLRPVFLFFLRPQIIIDDKIKYQGPYIIVANHQSYLDPPALGCLLPRNWEIYPLRFATKDSLMAIPIIGGFLKALGAFPVKKGQGLNHIIDRSKAILRKNQSLLIFPQGGHKKTLEIEQGRKGAAAIALESKVPILPIGLFGIYKTGFLDFFLKKRHLIIFVGSPFVLKRNQQKEIEQDAMEQTPALMEQIKILVDRGKKISKEN